MPDGATFVDQGRNPTALNRIVHFIDPCYRRDVEVDAVRRRVRKSDYLNDDRCKCSM